MKLSPRQTSKEMDKNDGTEFGGKGCKNSKNVSTLLNNIYKENERKRPISMSEKSQDDTWDHKWQRFASKQDASEGSGGKPSQTAKEEGSSNVNRQQGDHLWHYIKSESHEPVVGLSALIECHCDQRAPIYLCECCSLKILEKDIVSHVTGLYHQKVFLGLQELSWNKQRKTVRQQAKLVGKDKGYGNAKVVDLNEEIYNDISKQSFKSAIQTVKALHAQQVSGCELPSTTALSGVHPVDTSAAAAHHQTTLMSLSPENKSPPTEISHTSARKTKPRERGPKVGLNQLIVVSCEGKRQVYCQLCSVKLNSSRHPLRFEHKYNYVKMLYPWWTAKPSEVESKLDKMVANLAHVEKDVGSRSAQTMEVSIDEYNELNGLPDNKALERVKAMVKQSESQVSSSTTDAAEVLRQQVAIASPCEISSPDDGTSMPQNEIAGRSTDNQSEHENKHELQTPVKMGKPQCCASPLAADSESARRFAQTPGTCQETLLRGKQQERSDPDLQDGQKVLEGTQKTSPVKLFNTDLLPSSASVNTEQQQQSRPNQKAEHVTKHHSASQALSRMSIGKKTQDSHLSTYLMVRGLENEPVIGLGSIWECRGITQKTFFLCESCKVMLSVGLICDHIISIEHKFKYALKQDPKLMSLWQDDERQEEILLEHLLKIVDELLDRERLEKTKAQCVMLGNELYEYLQKASFSEALRIVKDVWKEQRLSVLCLPPSQQKDQQPYGRQSQEDSLHYNNILVERSYVSSYHSFINRSR